MGLGTVSSAKAHTRGSTDLINFYATSHALAHGQLRIPPCLSHHIVTGYVSNNRSAISCLISPHSTAEGHCQDTTTSTTAEHFKPFWFPDGRSLLPWHVHQSLGVKVTTTDYLPSMCGHQGEEMLPVLPAGSERGSRFRQEVPGSLDRMVSRTPSHPPPAVPSLSSPAVPTQGLSVVDHTVPRISRGLQAPRVTQVAQLGQQGAGRKKLLGFTINYGQDVTPRPTRSTTAPAWCWRGPTWMPGCVGGIQPQRPSGFSTNNHPTRLEDIGGHLVA
ncbi:protein phosphatase 1 regulatory subunit 32 [Falco peregrinus]|uniref:protein phosphatase 1 regulatory subunit 32 n=1 Tax=Falco peregrinus TaxID=8954 RepID=UPI000678B7F1|nr:protein phosphatase 1 regulatory subunit 32 [Falco peregrinus]